MKKLTTIFGAFLITSVALTSCTGGDMRADAKKLCDIKCQGELMKTMEDTEENLAMGLELMNEVVVVMKEMKEKYLDDDKLKKELAQLISECDCN